MPLSQSDFVSIVYGKAAILTITESLYSVDQAILFLSHLGGLMQRFTITVTSRSKPELSLVELDRMPPYYVSHCRSMLTLKHPPTFLKTIGARCLSLTFSLVAACDEVTTNLATGDKITTGTYDATATVTYTWQVEYAESFDQARTIRRETFDSISLVNRNGVKPEAAVTGPDDEGLYWPALPPEPTADELESRQKNSREKRTDPTLLKDVDYAITFDYDGQRRTLPTNKNVYREAAKAYAEEQALELTYGPGEETVGAARRMASFDR